MLKKVTSLMTAALMLQGVASADLAGDLMCGHFWVAGEALLLRPTGAYPYVAFIGPYVGASQPPVGCQLANCPDYEWGYKIEAGYRNCDKELLVNWLSWNNGYNDKFKFSMEQTAFNNIGSINAYASFDGPGEIKAISCLKYDALDAEVAKWMCKECSKWSARGFLGLRYARIRNGRTVVAVDGETIQEVITGFSDVQGTGPRFGVGARWNLWCDFGLTGSVAGHMLIGSAKSQHVDFTPGEGSVLPTIYSNVKNRKVCRIIPASEVKFGLDWNGCLFCGFSGELGVGYQISHYFYGDQSTLFTQNNTATNHVHTDPMSFDGWYFRLGLMY